MPGFSNHALTLFLSPFLSSFATVNQFCSQATLHEVYISKFATLDESLAEALQAACDKFDTGLSVVSIRVTKPRIPESVRRNYEDVERATSELQVAAREQDVASRLSACARPWLLPETPRWPSLRLSE